MRPLCFSGALSGSRTGLLPWLIWVDPFFKFGHPLTMCKPSSRRGVEPDGHRNRRYDDRERPRVAAQSFQEIIDGVCCKHAKPPLANNAIENQAAELVSVLNLSAFVPQRQKNSV